ncbi:hypothetical protein GEMRC1_001065 [Eukaryota sp. GEM-RC1]
MYQCFHNSSLEMSVGGASYKTLNNNEIEVFTGDLYGFNEFVISVQLFPQLIRIISIPVTALVANNTDNVCFVGIPCSITVYSYLEDFSFSDTFVNSNIPNSLQISNYQASSSLITITFTSSISGVPNELSICSESVCFPIFNIPFVVSPSHMFPQFVQWFGKPLTLIVTVEIEGISLYDYSIIQNSFSFSNSSSQLINVTNSKIHFEVQIFTSGTTSLQSVSFGHLSNQSTLTVSNFVIFPPKVFYNSVIECYLLEPISDLFITHGKIRFHLTPGANIFTISEASPSIFLSKSMESINISSVSYYNVNISSIIEINTVHTIVIDVVDPNYVYAMSCSDNCELTTTYSSMNQFDLCFVGFDEGIVELTFSIQYFQSNFYFVYQIIVHQPPLVQLVSPTVMSLSNPDSIIVSFVGDFNPSSLFLINDILTKPTEIHARSSSRFKLSYIFDKFAFNFSKGENHQTWYWKHSGFNLQSVGDVVIFDINAWSTDFVSPLLHRTISVNFEGILYSNLTCSIGSQQFKGILSNNSLSCNDVIIPTFQEFVIVKLSLSDIIVDSLHVRGEAFLEEVCFVSSSVHPKLNLFNSGLNSVIIDSIRCCNVDVSQCAQFISKFQSIVVKLNSTFDVFQFVITTNSSCQEFRSNLPFDLIIDNQTILLSYYCHQIPSGFAFASNVYH